VKATDQPADQHSPLPQPAVEALARIEARFPLVQAATQYETAALHAAQLAAIAESGRMTDLDADSLAVAEDLMSDARTVLAAGGCLDLIGSSA
jgi:hypothetical protein